MAEQGIYYRPLTFSSYGRAHPDAVALLTTVAQRAARRRGLGDHQVLLRWAMAKIGVQIWRRAAAMVRACLPRMSEDEAALLRGTDPSGGDEPSPGISSAARAGVGLVTAGGPAVLGA